MTSLSFIFIYIPIIAVVFYLAPGRLRSLVLLVASLILYAQMQMVYIPLMLAQVVVSYKVTPLIVAGDNRKFALWGSITLNMLLIISSSALSQIYEVEAPLGVMIYALTSLGYSLDIYSGEAESASNFVDFALAHCFFPKLFAGPIVGYNDIIRDIQNLSPTSDDVFTGATLFVKGLAKKVIIADTIAAVFLEVKSYPTAEATVLSAWILVITATLMTYFTLSSLCDMACGLGRVCGIHLPRNFYYPFEAASVSDFFARFNITVSNFIKKHIYVTLGSADGSKLSASLNLLLISMLMGLWYGISLNMLVWGAVLGVFTIVEIVLIPNIVASIPNFYRKIYTFIITFFSFAIFAGDSLMQSFDYLKVMFGIIPAELYNDKIMYALTSNYLFLIIALIGCTSVVNKLGMAFKEKLPRQGEIVTLIFCLILLTLTLGFIL